MKELELKLEAEELEERIAPSIFSYGSVLQFVSSSDANLYNSNYARASNSGLSVGAVLAANIPYNVANAVS